MRQLYVDQDVDNGVQKFSFYSPSEGYVAFSKWIGFTSDSGRTFVKKYITLNNVDFNGYLPNLTFGFSINGVKAFNKDILIAYGDYGFVPAILYSSNGGTSFKLVFHSQYDPMQIRTGVMDMVFPDNGDVGFAVDADRILRTIDKGLSWSPVGILPGSYLNNVQASGYTVFAYNTGGTNRTLYYSRDYGANWIPYSFPQGTLNAAYFSGDWMGWANVDDDGVGKTYNTSNGGLSWEQVNNAVTPFMCLKMRFINDSTGYALSGGFITLKTSDGGKIWERLPRNNDYSYLLYSHTDLQCMGNTQVWAGGGHGFIEMSTNAGGTPIPSAYFSVDTSGEWSSRIVKLQNFSKAGYQYKWLKNGTLLSTTYHTSFTHDFNKLRDTVQLIVSNGVHADTAIQYVNYYPAALINSFTPATTGKGTTVTIKGAGFTDAVSVSFGGIAAASFNVLSDTEITAIVGDGASGSVAVTTAHRYAELAGFTFVPPPDITSFSPAAAAAGTTVTITGKYLTGADGVLFGGIPAVSFSVVSDTEIRAVLGKGSSGKITVSTFGGVDEIDGFRTIPVMSGFSPARGTNGSMIIITGTGFDAVTGVSFGGVPVKSFVIDSLSGITAEVGAGASGSVKVSNADGNSSLPGFTYLVPPIITAVNPLTAPAGSTVIISGSNFGINAADNVVYFGGVKATVTAASATSLSVTVPAGATYSPVSVTVNELSAYSSKPFSVSFPEGGSITAASFAQRTDYTAGPDPMMPYGGAFADLNNDGLPEMLINTSTPNNVGIWQNNSAGGQLNFSVIRLPAGENPNNIVTGDLDGDGLLDIVAGSDGPTVSVYRNTSAGGTIAFADKIELAGGRALITDLDLDGKPELIAGPNIYRNISSPGKIAFSSKPPVIAFAIITADIDGDGKPDLINCNGVPGTVSVIRNTSTIGNISFAAPVSYHVNSPLNVRVGDFDGDKRPDLAVPNSNGTRLSIFKNTGGPGAISFAPEKELIISSYPQDLAIGDLDGDGKVDVAIAGYSTMQLMVYKNVSTSADISFAPGVGYSLPNYPQRIAIGDLNGDAKPEILVTAGGYMLYVFTNNVKREPQITSFTPTIAEQGTTVTIKGNNFSTATGVTFGGTPAASYTVNSDTLITAVVGPGASGEVVVTNSRGTGARQGFVFGQPPVITSCTPAYGPVGSRVTINGHHFGAGAQNNVVYFGAVKASIVSATADAIVAVVPTGTTPEPLTVTTNGRTAYAPQPFVVTFATADTTFTPASFVQSLDMPAAHSGCIADFDNDGKLDIVYPGIQNGLMISRNTSIPEKISFAAASSFAIGTDQTIAPVAVDLDNDGKLDLMVSHGYQTALLKNTSTANNISFAQKAEILAVGGSYSKAAGDLDGDGYPDLAFSNYGFNALGIFRNISHGDQIAMAERVDYPLNYYPASVSIADLDGDRKPEVIIAGSSGVTVYRNISIPGTIILDKPLTFPATSSQAVHAADIDGDGKKDLVVSAVDEHVTIVLRNSSSTGNIAFEAAQPYTGGPSAYGMAIGDLNGDNKLDVVSDISVLKNIGSSGKVMLQTKTDYASGSSANAIGDMDGDGVPDIVSFKIDYKVSILRNRSHKAVYIRWCAGMDTALTSNMTGTRYQWQEDAGSGFVNITDNAEISGATTNKLRFNDVQVSRNGYSYRCLVNDSSNREYVLGIGNGSAPVVELVADSIICSGQRVLFVTYVTNGGANPVYQWLLNGKTIPGQTDGTFASSTLKNSDRISVSVTNSSACIPTALSKTITMQVRQKVRAGGKAHAPFRADVDAVFPVTLDCENIPKDALVELYTQLDNGPFTQLTQTNFDGVSSVVSLLSYYNPTAGVARYYFKITPLDTTCIQAGTSDTVTVRIEPPVDSTVIIPLCENGNVTLASGLTASTYQWQQDKGTGFAAISDNANFSGTRTATLRLTKVPVSWLGYRYRCVTGTPNKAVYQLQTNRNVVPSVSITASKTTICSGALVEFTSTVFNAGSNPGYQWLVNGQPVDFLGQYSSFNSVSMKNADVVSLQMSSNLACPTPATITSSAITMDVTEEPVIAANGFTLTISAGYRSDAAYTWQILEGDWKDVVPAATKQHYYAIQPGTYRVRVQKGECTFTSAGQAVVITAVSPDPDIAAGIQLYPNPVQTDLNINSLKLSDHWETLDIMSIDGKSQISRFNIAGQTKVTLSIAQLNSGSYLAVLRRKNGAPVVKRFIKL